VSARWLGHSRSLFFLRSDCLYDPPLKCGVWERDRVAGAVDVPEGFIGHSCWECRLPIDHAFHSPSSVPLIILQDGAPFESSSIIIIIIIIIGAPPFLYVADLCSVCNSGSTCYMSFCSYYGVVLNPGICFLRYLGCYAEFCSLKTAHLGSLVVKALFHKPEGRGLETRRGE
jgi:hypothetical protein